MTAPDRSRGRRAVQVTAIVSVIGVLVAALGLVWATRPLRTPTQDCGTAASYLMAGRVDEFVDPANPPEGVTKAEAEANNATPCQERAANRARPAGALVVGGTGLALIALFGEAAVRLGLRRRMRRR